MTNDTETLRDSLDDGINEDQQGTECATNLIEFDWKHQRTLTDGRIARFNFSFYVRLWPVVWLVSAATVVGLIWSAVR